MLKKYTETEHLRAINPATFLEERKTINREVLEGTKEEILEWLNVNIPTLDRSKVRDNRELSGKCFFDSSSKFPDFKTQLDGLTKQDSMLFYFYQHPIDPTKTYTIPASDGVPELAIPQIHLNIKSLKIILTNS